MREKLFKDSILDNCTTYALATMPMWVLGMLGVKVMYWAAHIIAGAAVLIGVIRLIMLLRKGSSPYISERFDYGTKIAISLAFSEAVAEGIMQYVKGEAITGYIFALFLFIISLIISFAPKRK